MGVGFGSFRIDDPVDVPVTLEKTTTSGGITTTTTAESTLFVKAKGEGALVMADFRCGLMLTPDVAALLDFAFGGMFWEGLTIPDESDGAEVVGVSAGERGTPIQLHVGASAQVFVVGPLWVRGGFGLGVITYDRDPDSEEGNASSVGAGVLASVGVQLSQKWITDRSNKAPSLEIQYLGGPLGTNAYAHGATVGVGYQWY